jgi:hypothetical protein
MPPYSSRNPRPMQQQTRAWAPQQAPAPIERPSYTPSAYQQAIIDWLLTGTGNALVDAKAGSGKTSTLCMLSDVIMCRLLRGTLCAVAHCCACQSLPVSPTCARG